MGPAPRCHLLGLDIIVATGLEPLLYEKKLGVVVGTLGEDTTTASPGRDHVEGYTEARAGVDITKQPEGILHPLASSAFRRMERSDMVSEATRF